MPWLALEHSRAAYRADFTLYGIASITMALALTYYLPAGSGGTMALWALSGGAGWTLVEYVLHRFILHGLPPFSGWHAQHHLRPTALIASPIWLSATLFATLVALPAWWLLGGWPACALTFGLVTGYLAYGLTHHAVHHSSPWLRGYNAWLTRRRRWHSLHHGAATPGSSIKQGHFGVSSGLWDWVFRTHVMAVPERTELPTGP